MTLHVLCGLLGQRGKARVSAAYTSWSPPTKSYITLHYTQRSGIALRQMSYNDQETQGSGSARAVLRLTHTVQTWKCRRVFAARFSYCPPRHL